MKRKAFSVVEIVVVFALMLFVVVAAGVQPLKLFRDTTTRECKRMIQHNVRQAYQYAVITQAGMTLNFAMDEEELTLTMKGENTPNRNIKKLLEFGNSIEKSPKPVLILHDDQRIEAPFAITFYPDGECNEERTAAPIKAIEIAHASNKGTLTIDLKLPESPYASKAPPSSALYPKPQAL